MSSDDVRMLDPRFVAGVALIGHTGATSFRVGWNDEAEPVVWFACAAYRQGAEATGALDPVTAVMRLCEQIIDGGTCTHCGQPTIFDPDMPMGGVVDELLQRMGCVYSFDPELAIYRRGCEGD